LSNTFVKDPHTVVKAGQVVKVKVLEVDEKRKRIALTMRLTDSAAQADGRTGQRDASAPRDSRSQAKGVAVNKQRAPQHAPDNGNGGRFLKTENVKDREFR